jgi:hypothetical protein
VVVSVGGPMRYVMREMVDGLITAAVEVMEVTIIEEEIVDIIIAMKEKYIEEEKEEEKDIEEKEEEKEEEKYIEEELVIKRTVMVDGVRM